MKYYYGDQIAGCVQSVFAVFLWCTHYSYEVYVKTELM